MIEIALTKDLHGAAGTLRLDVNADIDKRSFVTLFGPSGAGKTTILKMLAGLLRPEHGRVVVDGVAWFDAERRIDLPPQQRAIGFVFQDYALFPNMSVRDNIAYGAQRGENRWVDELLDLTGLAALRDRRPSALSGGQKQRVALARAVARKPALLLLDEPLSALDMAMRIQLQDVLARLHRELGLTTLLVSHDIGEVFKLSQRVLRLEGGRITHAGTPSEVFLQRRLSGKFHLQAQVLQVRKEEVVHIVTLLIGQDIVEVIASEDEVEELRAGDAISVSTKAVSPYLFKATR